MKSTNFSAKARCLVPFRMPTNSICRKQAPSATIAAVGGSLTGLVASITSKGGLDEYDTTIGRVPPWAVNSVL